MKKWVLRKCDVTKATELTTKYGLDPLLAHVLAARGITEQQELKSYFSSSGELSDPFEIKDMDKAVERIREALERRYTKILEGLNTTAKALVDVSF